MPRFTLGVNQRVCLRALLTHHDYPGKWELSSPSATIRVLDTLVSKGLVETYEVRSHRDPRVTFTRYRITQNGRAILNIIRTED